MLGLNRPFFKASRLHRREIITVPLKTSSTGDTVISSHVPLVEDTALILGEWRVSLAERPTPGLGARAVGTLIPAAAGGLGRS